MRCDDLPQQPCSVVGRLIKSCLRSSGLGSCSFISGVLPGNVVVQIRHESDDVLTVDFDVSDAVPIVLIVDPLPAGVEFFFELDDPGLCDDYPDRR